MFWIASVILSSTVSVHEWSRDLVKNPKLDQWVKETLFPQGFNRPITSSRDQVRTNAFLVVKDGKIVAEAYQNGFGPKVPHLSWSVTKSFMNTMVGVAVREKLVDLDLRVGKYFPNLSNSNLSLRHLLHWESGIRWNEGYEYNPIHSRVIQMLFSVGRSDMAEFVASLGFEWEPGTKHRYSSGDSVLISGLMKRHLGEKLYEDFLKKKVFEVLSMNSVTFEKDASGTYIGSSFLYASPEDLARWGAMYLQKGLWQGQRILDEDWIEWSTQVAPHFDEAKLHQFEKWIFPGAHFWVNRPSPQIGDERVWKRLPEDFYMAKGHWGQAVGIIPSANMVVVRFADDRSDVFDFEKFFADLIELIK